MLPVASADPPPSFLMWGTGALSCLVLGAVTGVVGTFAHQSVASIGVLRLPIGLVAALLAAACLVAGLRLALDSRLDSGLAALGLVAAVALLALPGPSGSALLPANPTGFAWTLGPTLISAFILSWPRGLGRRRPPRGGPSGRWNTGGGEESIQ